MSEPDIDKLKDIPFYKAVIPLFVLISFLTFNVFTFDDTLAGSNQMALMISAFIAIWIARGQGVSLGYKIRRQSDNK